ncbi:MAG: hypothetical protein RR495_07605 [Anaerovoracaceae bacterium]
MKGKESIMVKFKRFEVVSGIYIEEIVGQSRIGYSMSDSMTDFYDMVELSKKKLLQRFNHLIL